MGKIQNVLMKYLMPIANKLEQQKHIQAIKDGIIASIPIIIVGSFCTIFLGIANLIGSGPVYDFLSANMGVLTYASAFTNDMLAVYATYFIAKNLSEKYDLLVLLQLYLQLKFITFVTNTNGILKCQKVYHQWYKICLQP